MLHQEINQFLTYLQSVNTIQSYLYGCYERSNVPDAEKKSYENSYRFLYYLEHGRTFFQTGNKSELLVQPVLFFYGIVHLLKACLLTKCPDYPETTSLLAHGVTTRKRKKQQYSFLQDEVKCQHKGLFPYFSKHLFQLEQLPFLKTDMNKLLMTIPELNELYRFHYKKDIHTPVSYLGSYDLQFPLHLLDKYNATKDHFINKLTSQLNHIDIIQEQSDSLLVKLSKPLMPTSEGPFFFHMHEQTFNFPSSRNNFSTTHEIMSHYLLLYNLSMICRYETEWWGDLIHTFPNEDYPFIKEFLSITSKKTPLLLGYYLFSQK